MKWKKLHVIYELTMIILVTISLIAILSKQETPFLHTIIWSIFIVDVSIRFIRAATKWNYVKHNSFDILSVIPLEDMFIMARFARFLRLFRYKNIIKRYLDKFDIILANIHFIKFTVIIFLINIFISLILVAVDVFQWKQSFEWTFFNFFKFNYIAETNDLVALSVILKIAGVLYLGILLKKTLNVAKVYYDKWRSQRKVE